MLARGSGVKAALGAGMSVGSHPEGLGLISTSHLKASNRAIE